MTSTEHTTDDPRDEEGPAERPVQPIVIQTDSDRRAKISPVARWLLIGLGAMGGGWLLLQMADRIGGEAPVVVVDQGQGAALEPDAAAVDPTWLNPLEAPSMPPVSAEARRMIGSQPGAAHRLYLPTSFDVWRRTQPPFAAPGTDLCAWRLVVDETGVVVPTIEPDDGGVYLFDQVATPCGELPGTQGQLPGGSSTTTTSSPAASGPSR